MEIVPGIHEVDGVFWSKVYLIEDEHLALIDTGPAGSTQKVLDYIRRLGRLPTDVRYIFITHAHPDHTGSAASLKKATGAQILAHPADTKTHKNGTVSLNYMGVFGSLPVPVPFLRRVEVDHLVEDGEVFPLRGSTKVLHTPGHTPGSICILIEKEGIIFTGDTVLSNGKSLGSSVFFPGSNERHYSKSLSELGGVSFQTACGGHGRPLVGRASQELAKLIKRYPHYSLWDRIASRVPILARLSSYYRDLLLSRKNRSNS